MKWDCKIPLQCKHMKNMMHFWSKGLVLGNGSHLGRHLEYRSNARFAKVANAGFQNYRPRRAFWYIETNVVLRRPPTPISKLLFEPYLLHYFYWRRQWDSILHGRGT